jgi:predicted transcriptional regulator
MDFKDRRIWYAVAAVIIVLVVIGCAAGWFVTDDAEPPSSLAQLTAEIVAAYVSNNQIATADLAGLISAVAGQLGKIGAEPEESAEEQRGPAVSVRRSVRGDHLVCLVCGQRQKMLKRHLAVRHDLTPAQYRERFELKPDYPMTAPKYAQQRRDLALQSGLGRPKRQARRGRRPGARPWAADQGQQEW